jgi:AcrR family transcriptional regulator
MAKASVSKLVPKVPKVPNVPGATRRAAYSASTKRALIDVAEQRFTEAGYAAASLDAIVAGARVTKGALYHHFSGKRDLFAAVFAAEQVRISGAILAAAGRERDPWDAFEAGCRAFIEACQEPGVQRITLLDAPAALGWETIRELESGSLKMMEQGIQQAIDAGSIEPRPVAPLAHFLFGSVCESAMVVARAIDQQAALDEALDELHRVLRSLAR